ncbi:glycerate kinase [Microbacterium sp. cx-59]|uniref:glycerate kinase n=1 Tax=Microbacterium sp. cx-59 TaxID=2891207 RepID=UPI001E390553|nr:glycerate kinase [Microbacterium sp. cx-59]MCC4908369.1 glycerate kinase [Microbacterium sp. cx-59]
MMRVVFAPDSFKGSVSAAAAARALAAGWRQVDPDVDAVLRPMADGGEGTAAAFLDAVPGARRIPVVVPAPAPGLRPVSTSWVLLPPDPAAPGGTAVVDLASTAGIELFGRDLDPWSASSFGFGVAIAAALDHGVSRLVLGIGSSASTDGGAGVLAALGARIDVGTADADSPGTRGAAGLGAIRAIDLTPVRAAPPGGVVVLTDVTHPLLGERGAAHVFGPQKGFAPQDLPAVDDALRRYAALFDLDPRAPGAGAAGGVGFALAAWGAELVPGAAAVADLIGVDAAAASAAWVVTGEGSFDAQSAAGKVPALIAARSASPVALVAGRITADADTSAFAATLSLSAIAGSAEEAMRRPEHWLAEAGRRLACAAVR